MFKPATTHAVQFILEGMLRAGGLWSTSSRELLIPRRLRGSGMKKDLGISMRLRCENMRSCPGV